ncbi:hypothetical protein Igag_1319 [Ignisphaera aggregans DSM 17230]|uniref:Uncharacterized protein n=1 Tax=Ignisphaera aggregans (strain DSM 17230 / JCM 13409 / AQ1.S1) TaxID=583356 RepID=E0SPR7_IGNAA|nr:hypothetical protein Igag_1319 [Ignisphaera aggregans DSM 17230]
MTRVDREIINKLLSEAREALDEIRELFLRKILESL